MAIHCKTTPIVPVGAVVRNARKVALVAVTDITLAYSGVTLLCIALTITCGTEVKASNGITTFVPVVPCVIGAGIVPQRTLIPLPKFVFCKQILS